MNQLENKLHKLVDRLKRFKNIFNNNYDYKLNSLIILEDYDDFSDDFKNALIDNPDIFITIFYNIKNNISYDNISKIYDKYYKILFDYIIKNNLLDNNLTDNNLTDNQLSDNHSTDNQLSDNQLSDNHSIDNQLSDNQLDDNYLVSDYLRPNQKIAIENTILQ